MKPTVLIGIPRRETTSTAFQDCLNALETVPGTVIGREGRTGVLPGSRNRIVREAQELGAEFIWWLDDDQPFNPDALGRLLEHDLDAVIGVSLRRKPPFAPLLYKEIREDGGAIQYFFNSYDRGVIPMAGAGMHGLLIRRSVLDAMGDPWFQFERSIANNDDYAEDFPFYRRLREMGIQLHCDLNVRFGHEYRCIVWPTKDKNGNWQTVMADDQPFAILPAAFDPNASPIIRPEEVARGRR